MTEDEPWHPNGVAFSTGSRHQQEKFDSHLHSHSHLTNNIHLRNLYQMQRHRVLMEARNSCELPLMQELTILRRARSLRDPSTSPAWSNSSFGSRRLHARETKATFSSDSGRDLRKIFRGDGGDSPATTVGKREKLDVRAGHHHWAGEFLGEGASDLQHQQLLENGDQKKNHILLKSSGLMKDEVYQNHRQHPSVDEREKPKNSTEGGMLNTYNSKKGSRGLEKSRSYPRVGNASEGDDGGQQGHKNSKWRTTRSSGDQEREVHSERENMAGVAEGGGSNLGERMMTEDERLQRGSVRIAVDNNGWTEEPEGRAEIARRVISEISKGSAAAALRGSVVSSGSNTRLPSPVFAPKASTTAAAAALAHSRRREQHSDLLSVMSLVNHETEAPGGYGDDAEGEEEEEEEEEDEISLRNGMKQLPSSLSSHTYSPLLFRDSMTTNATNERITTPKSRRRTKGSFSASRDGSFGERRHREGINVRLVGKAIPKRRLRGGRRSTLRPSLSASSLRNGGRLGFVSMEGELEVSELPHNGCGIPWYWTRIHKYRGRRFLHIAGRSLACGFTTERGGTKRKDDNKLDISKQQQQIRSNARRDSVRSDHQLLSIGGSKSCRYGDRSSDFEHHLGSRLFDDSPEVVPRADGNLLTADRSDDLVVFGSTREELSGILVPSSGYGNEFPGLIPLSSVVLDLPPSAGTSAPIRSLSQKYRPRSFSEIVGQSLVTKTLSTAIAKSKIAPIYLFQGPRGTGKSSAARIFARALNCLSDSPEQLGTTKPCGFCAECTNSSSSDLPEFDATSISGVDSVKALFGSMLGAPPSSASPCRVFIIDDCHCLPAEAWNTFLKSLEKHPWHVVFILITTDADKVPRIVVSRCQKFLFSKIKEVEVVNRLQSLARQEGLEVEEPALALVAARSQGSLRDAETVLDQLSLLGKKVSLSMVQEMVGLVSDEKLIQLLDLAMSAEAVRTVRCTRELLDCGVEPLALVSQLATLITDILAGTYIISREKLNQGFFVRGSSRKEEALRLRQALKVLSEAEKQLRLSSDQPTWLTAALLQFAPDRSFQPSSLETSLVASPIAAFNDTSEKESVGDSVQAWTSEEQIQSHPENSKGEISSRREQVYIPPSYAEKRKKNGTSSCYAEAKVHPAVSPVIRRLGSSDDGRPSNARSDTPLLPEPIDDLTQRDFNVMTQRKLEEVWQRVLHGSRSNVLRQLLQGQGKLLSLLVSDAFAVAHLEFRYPEHKARAERSRSRICNAFQMSLGCPVELQITLACMPSEQQQLSFTSFEDQQQIFAGRHKEKPKLNSATADRRSYEMKSTSHSRRRQRGARVQRHTGSMDVSQSLYNAVMGDSKFLKPEIIPIADSSRWGRRGGPPDGRHEEEHSERPSETRTFSAPLAQQLRHMENPPINYGPALISRPAPGKVPFKTVIRQYDDSLASPNRELQTDIRCGGSSSRRTSMKFRDVNSGRPSASMEHDNVRSEFRIKPSQLESRLLCWRVQKLDEDKIKVQRGRRQTRVRLLLKLVPCAKTHTNARKKSQPLNSDNTSSHLVL